jgi:phytoene desaturase
MKIAVIGAGVAGLTTAAKLVKNGFHVDVYDSSPQVGGKMYQYINEEGLSWDTGPTLISLPNEIRQTFLELEFQCPELIPLNENCHLIFKDGTQWKLPLGINNILDYFSSFDIELSAQLKKIMNMSKFIFEFADSTLFHTPPPSFLSMGVKSFNSGFIFKNTNIALKPYEEVINNHIKNINMREFFYHFSSYIGQLPKLSQGGILSIAHVELGSEIVFPKGGVYSIANSLHQCCLKYGAKFKLNTEVMSAEKNQSSWKIISKNENNIESQNYDLLISNSDPYVASNTWLKNTPIASSFNEKLKSNKMTESESQFVLLYDWKDYTPISHHVKIFPESWRQSFEEVFIRKRLPDDPCIYLVWPHATDKSISPRVLFISAMAPNTKSNIKWDNETSLNYAKKILNICKDRTNLSFEGEIFKMITPDELETRAHGLKGGIYSAAPTKFNAMHFHFSGVPKIDNLYFVGAGTHPGAGVTMVMKSARRISNLILKNYSNKSRISKNKIEDHSLSMER